MPTKKRRRVIIMGAAGRDFHNFNVLFREDPSHEVVAFTATQIPGIECREYPSELAGPLYPDGIQVYPEKELVRLIRELLVDGVIFAYSDVSHEHVMHAASEVMAAGADFCLVGPRATMLKSSKPVIAVCAVRTGAGKSPATRRLAEDLRGRGLRVVVMRHPMPYGNLLKQRVQRFASLKDLDAQEATIEEREDYEPHIRNGFTVFSGVDYGEILRAAEREADVILWDGGNNDFSFIRPDLMVTVADAYRPGHELLFHPGEVNFRMADIILINKVGRGNATGAARIEGNAKRLNPDAKIIRARLEPSIENPKVVRGKRVLAIEDGPTVTHGGMRFGAAYVVAKKYGAKELVDPRPHAVGSIAETFEKYRHLRNVLPAVGYSEAQVRDLKETIDAIDCDLILSGTPTDLSRIIRMEKPFYQVCYSLEPVGRERLEDSVWNALRKRGLKEFSEGGPDPNEGKDLKRKHRNS
jgi:predicted GTPase